MQVFSKKEFVNRYGLIIHKFALKVKEETRILPSPLLSIVILEDVFNLNALNSLCQSIVRQTLNSLEMLIIRKRQNELQSGNQVNLILKSPENVVQWRK